MRKLITVVAAAVLGFAMSPAHAAKGDTRLSTTTATTSGSTTTWKKNFAPTISGTPSSMATVGFGYSFQPSASDRNGDPLTFMISGKPAWASFSVSTGLLTGTPTAAGTFSSIVISVTDGRSTRSLTPFSISVSAPAVANQPPTINGTPPTSVNQGTAYAFQPTASDPEGKPLTFSVQNKPAWASFDASTGRLSGTPTSADVGTYASIAIAASDGANTATLPAYSLTVNQVANGQVTVSWAAPQLNTDGTPLTDLSGYKIYYGTSTTALSRVVAVGTNLTSYVIQNLSTGTWYVAMTAVNSQGVESAQSTPASKTVL